MRETRNVLALVERGEVDVEEALKLLEPVQQPVPRRRRPPRARWIRLQIRDDGDGTNLNFRIPMALVGLALGMVRLVIRLIPDSRWEEWTGDGGADDEDDGRAGGLNGRIGKKEILAILAGIPQMAIEGTEVDVNDHSDKVLVRFE